MEKVYVNTVEEVLEALNKGFTIKDENYPRSFYKKDETIVCEGKDWKALNEPMLISKNGASKFYYEYEKPFEIEVGKMYKSSSEEKVFIFGYLQYNRKYLGVIVGNEMLRSVYRFNKDGSQTHSYLNLKLKKEIKPE